MRNGVMLFAVVMMVAVSGQVMAQQDEGKGMIDNKGMGFHHCMMKKMEPIVVPTNDAGVVVVIGNKMTKYDQDLDVVKEVELNFEGVHKLMNEMKKACPIANQKAVSDEAPADVTAKDNAQVVPAEETVKEAVEVPAAETVTEETAKDVVTEPVGVNAEVVVPSEAPVEPANVVENAVPEMLKETVTETVQNTVIEPVTEKVGDAVQNATEEPAIVNATADVQSGTQK